MLTKNNGRYSCKEKLTEGGCTMKNNIRDVIIHDSVFVNALNSFENSMFDKKQSEVVIPREIESCMNENGSSLRIESKEEIPVKISNP